MRLVRVAAPFAVLVLGLSACGGGSSGGSTLGAQSSNPPSTNTGDSNSPTIAGLPANNHGAADVTGKSSVSIQAASYYFQPSVLKGTPGQKLTLHVTNGSSTQHNLTIDAQHVNSDLDGHASVDVHVTMPASGVLSFWCEYHKGNGMVGGLLVSGPVAGAGSPSPSASSDSGGGGYGGYGNG
jgi:plastocyanin